MNKDLMKMTAELALIRALPDFVCDDLKPGRLKGLYKKLVKAVNKEWDRYPKLSLNEEIAVNKNLIEFGVLTGWQGKKRHHITYVSFIAFFADRHTLINPIINDIVDYFERGNNLKQVCCRAGLTAFEKWEKLWKEENNG